MKTIRFGSWENEQKSSAWKLNTNISHAQLLLVSPFSLDEKTRKNVCCREFATADINKSNVFKNRPLSLFLHNQLM